MANITAAQVKQLRDQTGVGMMEAKKALAEADGDTDKAVELLRKAGQKLAAKKQDREAGEGVIGYYVHADQSIGALVAINCETDFVARTDRFKELAHDVAMHIVAAAPLYVKPEDVPAEVAEKERSLFAEQVAAEGKPAAVAEKIVTGKMEKFFSEVCLLHQPFIKDDSKTIEQLLQEAIAELGENIQIRSFTRLTK